jgi:hypothetical protein
LKKLAIIRTQDGVHRCPFGLSIQTACRNAGNSVLRMEALDNVEADDRDLQLEHNVAAYALHGAGRCIFADKLAENGRVVHCDYGEPGAGMRDSPMDAIQVYPRMFGAMGIHGYYSYPLASYWDNPGNANLFDGIYGYASQEEPGLIINADSTENTELDSADAERVSAAISDLIGHGDADE